MAGQKTNPGSPDAWVFQPSEVTLKWMDWWERPEKQTVNLVHQIEMGLKWKHRNVWNSRQSNMSRPKSLWCVLNQIRSHSFTALDHFKRASLRGSHSWSLPSLNKHYSNSLIKGRSCGHQIEQGWVKTYLEQWLGMSWLLRQMKQQALSWRGHNK